jgi:single-stranded-DNA-specific exonuclease
MQVIITDHHLTTKPTPNAEAVVNPNQLGCDFPSKAWQVLVLLLCTSKISQLPRSAGKKYQ